MTTYQDIASGRLVYTCNCGWVDVGHATSSATTRLGVGAGSLWRQINAEGAPYTAFRNKPLHWLLDHDVDPPKDAFKVVYRQDMGKRMLGTTWYVGETQAFAVRKGLSLSKREQVALSIFESVTHAFESLQGWPLMPTGDSSYSQEDLVSNLIGFYSVVRGFDYSACKPVGVKASQKVWNETGSVGASKNTKFLPFFHPCDDCKDKPEFPQVLRSIKPAVLGADHRAWNQLDDNPYQWSSPSLRGMY